MYNQTRVEEIQHGSTRELFKIVVIISRRTLELLEFNEQ